MHRFASFVRPPQAAGLAVVAALSLSAGAAVASPEFPAVVRTHVPMDCTPDCTLCHEVTPGRANTANKPFVLTLAQRGFGGADETQLINALAASIAAGDDSDADGTTNADELMGTFVTGQLTTDPNTPEGLDAPSANICPPEPVYGCGAAHVTRHPHAHAEYALFALLTALLGAGLWRRLTQRRVD